MKDRYADNAEAVVYLIFESGRFEKSRLFVMSRKNAIKFCSRLETSGQGVGGKWACAFTTYIDDWRQCLGTFRKEDGRFDRLLEELGINPIYRGGQTLEPEKKKHDVKLVQLALF